MISHPRAHFFPLPVLSLVFALAAAPAAFAQEQSAQPTAWEANRTVDDNATISTGVAKARDPLNSATSTSSIKEREITLLSPGSLADILRNVPGIRVEAGTGIANNSYTVRGLPLINAGAKYLQLQEDGLPVLEFGDFFVAPSDLFLRIDTTTAQIESIRGGSASTFASNAPGGVINVVSKTGDVAGGSIQLSAGGNYGLGRVDLDYGGNLGAGWRFHVGGFYRQGEGARRTGYSTISGGQVKANVTRQFDNGYIRFSAKLLDDRFPYYYTYPIAISGSNESPQFRDLAGFDINRDSPMSRYITTRLAPGANGTVEASNMHNDMQVRSTTLGFEGQFLLAGWTVTERFRYARNSTVQRELVPLGALPAAPFVDMVAGGGGSLTYANGPLAGQAINPATLNGNGTLLLSGLYQGDAPSLRNVTNDLRGTRVWRVGGGDLTTTLGLYRAVQDLVTAESMTTVLQDVRGNGQSALVDLTDADGTRLTQGGVIDYGFLGTSGLLRKVDVQYTVTAPYGSVNFQKGRLAIGASLRWDSGQVRGIAMADSTTRPHDMNGDGVIDSAGPEGAVAYLDSASAWPVHYNYGYLSYSAGVNYRFAAPLSAFVRYSRGARAGADSVIFSPALNTATGGLNERSAAYDPVRQLEGGFKYRAGILAANFTAFRAVSRETNTQIYNNDSGQQVVGVVSRGYRTTGAELEVRLRRGPFSTIGSLTLIDSTITTANDPTVVGKRPRHQPAFAYSFTPQFENTAITLGANLIGQGSSYSQDVNQLKMPGYVTVGAFLQVRPLKGLALGLNGSNLFNTRAFTDIADATMPASGVALARTMPGRLITGSARLFF